ncbi:hypothetical protein, partial [Rubrivirga sp.]|uniref:hypothetical protein n=1 Tax=Rubrivirga sp. TaxID=1885344 RepID=UPI003C729679
TNPSAWTVAATLESGGAAFGDRVFHSSGLKLFARRQVDDVVTAIDIQGDPVLEDDARTVTALGAGFAMRVSLRVVGPVHVGTESGISLERLRLQGGSVLEDGYRVVTRDRDRTKWRLGGPARLYVSVRL